MIEQEASGQMLMRSQSAVVERAIGKSNFATQVEIWKFSLSGVK
jgi:hypothetical protein